MYLDKFLTVDSVLIYFDKYIQYMYMIVQVLIPTGTLHNKGADKTKQLSNLFMVANSHHQPS